MCILEDNIQMDLKENWWEMCIGYIQLSLGLVTGFCAHDIDPSISIKVVEFLDQTKDHFFHEKEPAPWVYCIHKHIMRTKEFSSASFVVCLLSKHVKIKTKVDKAFTCRRTHCLFISLPTAVRTD
jgi:hypothetical protein